MQVEPEHSSKLTDPQAIVNDRAFALESPVEDSRDMNVNNAADGEPPLRHDVYHTPTRVNLMMVSQDQSFPVRALRQQ
jgi:hypothetical protein